MNYSLNVSRWSMFNLDAPSSREMAVCQSQTPPPQAVLHFQMPVGSSVGADRYSGLKAASPWKLWEQGEV